MAVVCWDIDGTLLTTARAGVIALELAAERVCGVRPDLAPLKTSGLTDGEIAVMVVEHCGGEAAPATVDALLRDYERRLPDCLPLRAGRVLPGAREALDDLAKRAGVVSLLLTGNTPAGAAAKLRHYGLLDHFAAGGAFCEGDEPREAIAARARDAARVASAGEPQAVYVIGDTPHDVRCGKAIGARTVAVATGAYGENELAATEPWALFPSLPDPGELAARLELNSR